MKPVLAFRQGGRVNRENIIFGGRPRSEFKAAIALDFFFIFSFFNSFFTFNYFSLLISV